MQKKFVTNLALLLFLNLLVKPFYIFAIDAEVQNQVGAEDYGMYFSIFSFSFLFNILLDLGITNFNTKNIAQNHQLLEKHFAGILSLKFILIAFYFLFSFFLGFIIGYDQMQLKMLVMLLINQSLASLILYFRSNLTGLHLFRQDSFISILDRVILIISMGWLLYGGITNQPIKIEWFILMQTGSYAFTALVAYFIVKRRTSNLNFKFKTNFSVMILKKSVPFALLVLMMTFYYRIDTVMLERMLPDGAEQSGIYAMGYRFFEASNNISYLFAVLLLPIFSRMIKLKEDVSKIVVLAFKILISGAIFLAIFSWFFSEEILSLLYQEHVDAASGPFKVLMICFVAIASNYIFGTLLTANGNLKVLNIIAFSGMILNIVLNLILIPKYFVLGSALASLITQIFTSIVQLFISVVHFKFKPDWTLILQFSVYILMLFFFTKMIYYTDWKLTYKFTAVVGLFIFLVSITGIISPRSFYLLLRSSRN
jgi:O-antigen/teichoic acid export membrane protein